MQSAAIFAALFFCAIDISILMYWPSTSRNGEYVYQVMDGDILDPDAYLGMYDDWRDVSTWPVSSRESEAVKKAAKQQADPLAKTGAARRTPGTAGR